MLRPVLLADFVYALVVAAFVARRIAEMIAARRRRSAGSKLHMRLVRFFTPIALIPTILVAVFATITLNFGLEGWFSDRVHNVVANSIAAAEAYEEEHRVTLQTDARDARRLPQRAEGALSAPLRRPAARPPDPRPAADAAGADEGLHHRRRRPAPRPRRAELSLLVHAAVARGHRPRPHRRGRRHPGLGEQRVLGAAAAPGLRRPLPLRQPRGRRQDPEPARRDPGDRAALPAARGRPRAAALRVRARLPRLRAGGDPGRDVDGALVRRAAGPAGRPAGRRGRAGGQGRSRRPGARGAGRRRDRAARAHLQRDDPAGEGPARRADRRQRRDRAAAAAVRLGAVGRHGRRDRPRRRRAGSR